MPISGEREIRKQEREACVEAALSLNCCKNGPRCHCTEQIVAAIEARGDPKVIGAYGITGDIQQQRLRIARESGEVYPGKLAFPCAGCGVALTGGDDTLCAVDLNGKVLFGVWCRPCANKHGWKEVDP